MNWATYAIAALSRGETAQVKPHGHSMRGKVNDGDLVTLAPCDPAKLAVGDVVLVRVHGSIYLHLVKAIDRGRFQIGNHRGGINQRNAGLLPGGLWHKSCSRLHNPDRVRGGLISTQDGAGRRQENAANRSGQIADH